jgi:DNA replicative helicase MCM subunit Mcm2 (Cdc46/Mcm family)
MTLTRPPSVVPPPAFFRCLVCSHTMQVDIERGKIAEPDICPREVCRSKGSMSLIHNRCAFADKQVVRLQETPGPSSHPLPYVPVRCH